MLLNPGDNTVKLIYVAALHLKLSHNTLFSQRKATIDKNIYLPEHLHWWRGEELELEGW